VLFVGINPGIRSAETGHHFAGAAFADFLLGHFNNAESQVGAPIADFRSNYPCSMILTGWVSWPTSRPCGRVNEVTIPASRSSDENTHAEAQQVRWGHRRSGITCKGLERGAGH
jgi:hypothetical protein